MVNTVECSDPLDSLANYSAFSLFPSLSSSSSPLTQNPNFNTFPYHLNHMVLQNPENLINQAKAILDGNLNGSESDKTMSTIYENQSESLFPVHDKNAQARRPALGLKRAKFSAKSFPSSQTDLSLEPSLDIEKLKDPDEYFAAVERMEQAQRELKKQMGQPLMDLDQNRTTLPPRRRRPSLLGKSATYKHRSYSSVGFPDNDEAVLSSQGASDPNIVSPSREETIPETDVMDISQKTRVLDVKSTVDNNGSELDELLSCNYEGLDEDGVQNLLQDKLNIKLIDIGKSFHIDLPDVRRREYESSREAVTNTKDTIYHAKGTSKAAINFGYQLRTSSTNYQVSPTLSNNPLASISLLDQHASKGTSSKDPYPCIDIDSPRDTVPSLGKESTKETNQINKTQQLLESLNSPGNEDENTGGFASHLNSEGNSGGLIDASNELMAVEYRDLKVTSEKSCELGRPPACGEENIAISTEKIPSPTPKDLAPSGELGELVDLFFSTAQCDARENLFESARSPAVGEDNLTDSTRMPTEQEDQAPEGRESTQKEVLSKGSGAEKPSFYRGEDGGIGEPIKPQSSTERPNKKKLRSLQSKRKEIGVPSVPSQEIVRVETVVKGRKGKAKAGAPVSNEPKNKRRKAGGALPVPIEVNERLHRLSLCEAGTKWEAGVRRSSRIRMRPLEYWRGERFLYGRVHQSMVSVIGVKYASPTKNGGEPGVKVKSFVSDEYKDLLELASLH